MVKKHVKESWRGLRIKKEEKVKSDHSTSPNPLITRGEKTIQGDFKQCRHSELVKKVTASLIKVKVHGFTNKLDFANESD